MTSPHNIRTVAVYSFLLVFALLSAVSHPLLTTDNAAQAQSSVPTAPTGLTHSSVAHDSVTLIWDDPSDSSITGYRILRRDVVSQSAGTFSTVAENTGTAATTYTDNTVAAETRYAYRVKAINSTGVSPQSRYLNVETPATPSVPARPTGLTSTSVTHDSVTLNWDEPEDSTITGYQVLRRSRDGTEHGDGEGAPEFIAIVDDTGTATTSYTDNTVTARTRYVYRVRAINPQGTSPWSTYLNVETPAAPPVPAAPTGLTYSSVAHDSVTLTWDDPKDSSITGYRISRRDVASQAEQEFTTIVADTGSTATSSTDATVEAETQYVYYVQAINPQGVSEQSNHVNVETTAEPTDTSNSNPNAPTAPAALTAPFVWFNFVTVTWDDPADSSITHYQVLRREGETGDFTVLEENTGSASTAYTDSTVDPDTEYQYRVIAVNGDGSSPESESLSVQTLAEPTLVVVTPEPTPTEEELLDNLVAMYQMSARKIAYSATMTVGNTTSGGKTYRGFASGTPVTIGSMSSRTINADLTTWPGCPDETDGDGDPVLVCARTVNEIYYVQADSRWHLVFRMGWNAPRTFTLTIGDNSYDLENAGYFISNTSTYNEFPVGPDMHFWWNVGDPGIAANDTVTVTLDRPVYTRAEPPPPPTDPDEFALSQVLSTNMEVGQAQNTIVGTRFESSGYVRSATSNIGELDDDSFSYDSTDYEIDSVFYIQITVLATNISSQSLNFSAEGPQLHDDASLYVGGVEYKIQDAVWLSPSQYQWTLSAKPGWADRSSASVALEAPQHNYRGDRVTDRLTVGSGWETYHLIATIEGYQDWFVANLESGNRYAVRIRHANNAGIRGVYEPTGTIAHGATHPALKTLVVDLRARGTRHYPSGDYQIRVWGFPDNLVDSYDIRVDRIP